MDAKPRAMMSLWRKVATLKFVGLLNPGVCHNVPAKPSLNRVWWVLIGYSAQLTALIQNTKSLKILETPTGFEAVIAGLEIWK